MTPPPASATPVPVPEAAPAPPPDDTPGETLHRVRIDSDPSGAEVLRDGVVLGVTPLTLEVPDGARWTLVLMRAGYGERTVTIAGVPPGGAAAEAPRELRVALLEADENAPAPRDRRRPAEVTTEPPAAREAPAPRTQTIRDPWER